VLEEFHLKIPHLPCNAGDFGEGDELNVEMPADLDQFGGEDS